jgi:uridylate kinase
MSLTSTGRFLSAGWEYYPVKIVFSIGGSILAPAKVDREYAAAAADMLLALSKKHRVAAVVGGGRPAREAIAKARARGASWAQCDNIGIQATRKNAKALISHLKGKSNREVPEGVKEAAKKFGKRILVMGGTEPGHSTDAVAALIADWVKADLFINASNVDAVYDKNPKKHPDARPLSEIRIDDLIRLLDGEGFNAGEYPLLDHVCLKIIKRAGFKAIVLDGRDLPNMKDAAEGKTFRGTVITP